MTTFNIRITAQTPSLQSRSAKENLPPEKRDAFFSGADQDKYRSGKATRDSFALNATPRPRKLSGNLNRKPSHQSLKEKISKIHLPSNQHFSDAKQPVLKSKKSVRFTDKGLKQSAFNLTPLPSTHRKVQSPIANQLLKEQALKLQIQNLNETKGAYVANKKAEYDTEHQHQRLKHQIANAQQAQHPETKPLLKRILDYWSTEKNTIPNPMPALRAEHTRLLELQKKLANRNLGLLALISDQDRLIRLSNALHPDEYAKPTARIRRIQKFLVDVQKMNVTIDQRDWKTYKSVIPDNIRNLEK